MARMSNLSSCFCFSFFCLVAFLPTSHSVCPGTMQHAPALFMFGDSVVDNGNNAFISSSVTTLNLPYGIDFPNGPTGRFTNGKNPADFLADDLNLPGLPPAVMDPAAKGSKILNGVNYASGGSGILDNPESEFIMLRGQVDFFENKTLPDLRTQFSSATELAHYLANSIFAFNTGGNDCTKACEDPYNVEECRDNVKLLVSNFTVQLKRINGLGGRKFVLFGAQPLGCNPGYVTNNNGECRSDLNLVVKLFSDELESSLGSLKEAMPNAYFVYVNAYKITEDVYQDPASQGFVEIKESCCERSGRPGCTPGLDPCPDRDEYMYFDGAHCTSAMYKLLVDESFCSEDLEIVKPFDIARLAAINLDPSAERAPMK